MKNSSIHILVIEDDPQIRNFISYVLKQEEFLCTAVGTAQAGMSELVSGTTSGSPPTITYLYSSSIIAL